MSSARPTTPSSDSDLWAETTSSNPGRLVRTSWWPVSGSRNPPGPNANRYASGVTSPSQAEAGGAGATPAQRGLAPRPVVVQGLAGMIVLAAQDRRLVVGDLVDAHRPEPRHGAALPSQPAGLK